MRKIAIIKRGDKKFMKWGIRNRIGKKDPKEAESAEPGALLNIYKK